MATDLITKLEEAGEGSAALDALVCDATNPNRSGPYSHTPSMMRAFGYDTRVTTSLDAALALAARLGWRLYKLDHSFPARPSVLLQSLDYRPGPDPETGAYMVGKDYASATASTPALALCAAILRASEQERGG